MDKFFDVMEIADDMVIGTDLIPLLFPHDRSNKYIGRPSAVTTPPTNVRFKRDPPSVKSIQQADEEIKKQFKITATKTGDTATPVHTSPAPPKSILKRSHRRHLHPSRRTVTFENDDDDDDEDKMKVEHTTSS